MQVKNLSKRVVETALRGGEIDGDPTPKNCEFFVWCGKTPGFGLRVYHPSRKGVFVAQVRVGRSIRRIRIGVFGPYTVEEARDRAQEIIGAAAGGRDPQREKRERRDAPTVTEICEMYLAAARAGLVVVKRFKRPKRQSTVVIDEGRVLRHIIPLIGSIRACDVTRQDVQKMVDDIAAGKTAGVFRGKPRGKAVVTGGSKTAARVAELLGGIFTWAERRGFVKGANGSPFVNPVRGVETIKCEPRTRVLNEETELRALGAVLAQAQLDAEVEAKERIERRQHSFDPAIHITVPAEVAVARLVALSGWRRSEWSTLQWSEIDWSAHCIRRDTKNGMWTRPVGEPVLEILKLLEQTKTSGRWVFPNQDGTGSADVKKKLAKLFDAAGLTDARSHDLRRTFSTIGDDEGYSEATIGMLIGDSPRGVVRKHYIHKPDEALIAAANRISRRIAAALDSNPFREPRRPVAQAVINFQRPTAA